MVDPARRTDGAVVGRVLSGNEEQLIGALADLRKQVGGRIVGQRDAIDEKLKDLGHGKRGRPPKEPGK